jgi:hypothetical protein
MSTIKTIRGTWDEIVSHKDELPPGALLEMRVLTPEPDTSESLYDRFSYLFGAVEGGPSDVAEHPEQYMNGFGETKDTPLGEP